MTTRATIENTRTKIITKQNLIKKLEQSKILLEYRIKRLKTELETLSELENLIENDLKPAPKTITF